VCIVAGLVAIAALYVLLFATAHSLQVTEQERERQVAADIEQPAHPR
jgi:hypothetical protein